MPRWQRVGQGLYSRSVKLLHRVNARPIERLPPRCCNSCRVHEETWSVIPTMHLLFSWLHHWGSDPSIGYSVASQLHAWFRASDKLRYFSVCLLVPVLSNDVYGRQISWVTARSSYRPTAAWRGTVQCLLRSLSVVYGIAFLIDVWQQITAVNSAHQDTELHIYIGLLFCADCAGCWTGRLHDNDHTCVSHEHSIAFL